MEQLHSTGFSPDNTTVANVNETSGSESDVKGKNQKKTVS